MYPSSIRTLIECLKDLPGLGEKSAERLAYAIVSFDKDKLDNFANSLLNIKDNIKRCTVCNCITDMNKCYICNDNNRNNDTIFVVEKSKDIILFEKMGLKGGKKTKTGYSTDAETLEEMIVYRACYDEGTLWVRPIAMWNEEVDVLGERVPRFTWIGVDPSVL